MIQVNAHNVAGAVGDNAPMPEGPILSRFANDPEMREIVALFVAEAPDRLRSMQEAWSQGDLRRVRTLAHQIKGAAGGYGYPEISAAAGALEAAAAAPAASLETAFTAFSEFTALLARVTVAG